MTAWSRPPMLSWVCVLTSVVVALLLESCCPLAPQWSTVSVPPTPSLLQPHKGPLHSRLLQLYTAESRSSHTVLFPPLSSSPLPNSAKEGSALSSISSLLPLAGYTPLSAPDLSSIQSLNENYLLRLSLTPDFSPLAPSPLPSEGAFGATVAMYWRGYGNETTQGRLVAEKMEYLQSNLVQAMIGYFADRLSQFESATRDRLNVTDSSVPTTLAPKALKRYTKMGIQTTCHDSNDPGGPVELSRRSISDVVDLTSKGGRRRLLRSLFARSTLVEPTYKELVVIWRPLPPPPPPPPLRPPQWVYTLFGIFSIDDRLPPPPPPPTPPEPQPVELRVYSDVPMANALACLPSTRLTFRPADALRLDLISFLSGLAVFATLRFDGPRLDAIAIASVTLWLLRLIFRYSNSLARYDLLVNRFLTSKISNRGLGPVHEYLSGRVASVRAARASLVYDWLQNGGDLDADDALIRGGLSDLEELGFVSGAGDNRTFVEDQDEVNDILKKRWNKLFG